jgi:decaprenyl-phosphate phosphoribosyltransferase
VITLKFVIRLEACAVLVEVSLSAWIVICSELLALFLAVAKRRDDVVRALDAGHRPSLAGYTRSDLDAGVPLKAKAPCRLARAY